VIGKPYLGITSRLPVIRPRIRARPDSFIYAGPSSCQQGTHGTRRPGRTGSRSRRRYEAD